MEGCTLQLLHESPLKGVGGTREGEAVNLDLLMYTILQYDIRLYIRQSLFLMQIILYVVAHAVCLLTDDIHET